MTHPLFRRLAFLLSALALLALGCESMPGMSGGKASEQPTIGWNQQLVTGLAAQLTSATEGAYTAAYQSPESIAPGGENASESMAGSLREMHEEAQSLHAKLEEGDGMTDTLNEYRRIKELSRDVGESSRYTDLGTSQAGPLEGVTSILNQLDAYYGAR